MRPPSGRIWNDIYKLLLQGRCLLEVLLLSLPTSLPKFPEGDLVSIVVRSQEPNNLSRATRMLEPNQSVLQPAELPGCPLTSKS